MTSAWSPPEPDAVEWRLLDGDLVAHVALTGCTHLVSPAAARIFRLLVAADAALSANELHRGLSGEPEAALEGLQPPDVQGILCELERIGLVQAKVHP